MESVFLYSIHTRGEGNDISFGIEAKVMRDLVNKGYVRKYKLCISGKHSRLYSSKAEMAFREQHDRRQKISHFLTGVR